MMKLKHLALYGLILVSGGCAAERTAAPRPAPLAGRADAEGHAWVRAIAPDSPDAMFIVDGEIVSSEHPGRDVDPKDVTSVKLIPGSDAVATYGPAGANGVVVVSTRHAPRRRTARARAANPLVLVDGAVVPAATLRDIAAERIVEMQVLAGPAAVQHFGDAAADGVVVVRTRLNDDDGR